MCRVSASFSKNVFSILLLSEKIGKKKRVSTTANLFILKLNLWLMINYSNYIIFLRLAAKCP